MSDRMRRILFPGVIFAALYMVLTVTSASAEVIHKFRADITINPDSSIDVTETINMDFEGDKKHGIYRVVPIDYERRDGDRCTLKFDLDTVQIDGVDSSDFTLHKQGGEEVIKIGNPHHKTITGKHTYKISYHVQGAVNFVGDDRSPELYWHVTGTDWPSEIENAEAYVHAPSAVALKDIHTESFVGQPGGTEHAKNSQGAAVKSFQAEHIAAGDEFAIVERLPAGSLKNSSVRQGQETAGQGQESASAEQNDDAPSEIVHKFHADITINPDASIDVTETVDMDFASDEKHGLYRLIPVRNRSGGPNNAIRFDLKGVQVDGADSSNYVMEKQGSDEKIKIGDPDKTLTGDHLYKIVYHVRRAVNFVGESQTPELYWNVTGDEWPFEIERAEANVYAPSTVALKDIQTESFYGPPGAKEYATNSQGRGFKSFQAKNLAPGEQLTIVERLPAGSVTKPPAVQLLLEQLMDLWPAIVLPSGTLLVMYVLWWSAHHNEDRNNVIAVEWNPPTSLSPAEVGTLVDESCDLPDVISTLVDLAVRGYLQIRQIHSDAMFMVPAEDDYEFTKTTPPKSDTLLPHESRFLDGMFATGNVVLLSELKDKFYATVDSVEDLVYLSLTERKLFHGNPDNIRKHYDSMATFFLIVGVVASASNSGLLTAWPWAVGGICSSVIISLFAGAMSARTAEGAKLTQQCLGFGRYVRLAEKERLRVLAKNDPTMFGRLLPYAMVLHCADEWARAFEGLVREPPDWYVSSSMNDSFSSCFFATSLGDGLRTMQDSLSSSPSGGSGGSGSGGGGGGGGGGSW